MPSGKQSKRQRRGARQTPPPVRGPGRSRRASPRVLLAAAAVLALIAVGIALGLLFSGGKSTAAVPARGSLKNALPGAAQVQRELKGIPQRGNVLGSPSAPVTMVEYVDLQCPYCRQFEVEAMPSLIARYVRTGKVKVETRIVAFIGPDSLRGRRAAIAAAKQNKLFNFAQLLYLNQQAENTGWLDDSMVQAAAASIPGLAVPQLLDERNTGAVGNQASTFDAQASADGVNSTPTILVGPSGGKLTYVPLPSPSDPSPVSAAIAKASK
jgi:protein-disulfide isomerase